MLAVAPLRSTRITRFLRYYERLRLPRRPPLDVMSSALRSFFLAGLPGSCPVLSAHAVPFHPGEPSDCIFSFLRRWFWLHPIRQTGRSHPWCHEAVSGSLALRLTHLPSEASPVGLLRPVLVGLHAVREIYMMNSFQFTRTARLFLAHRTTQNTRTE